MWQNERTDMKKYNRYSLALNDEEEKQYKSTNKGIKEIFQKGLEVLIREMVLETQLEDDI